MKDVAGSILPGGAKDFVFTFKAEKPGVFMEEWTFTGTPAVRPCLHPSPLCVCARVYVFICTYVCVCVCVYIYIHVCIYIYTHT